MATIKDFVGWLHADLSRWTRAGKSVEYVSHTGQSDGSGHAEEQIRVRIYTRTNSYAISAVEKNDGPGYLGCISKNRMPRAGEDQHRGNDLSDGPLSRETWDKILRDIVAYELVEVHGRGLPPIEMFAGSGARGAAQQRGAPASGVAGCYAESAQAQNRAGPHVSAPDVVYEPEQPERTGLVDAVGKPIVRRRDPIGYIRPRS